MSDTRPTDTARSTNHDTNYPRAVVHKRILTVAESRPDASMQTIAEAVSGATTTLVEQVLEEYGDPGDGDLAPNEGGDETSDEKFGPRSATANVPMTDHDTSTLPDPADITEKQLETLCEIHRHPEATQAELANSLGVSSATISQRVNGIDGFDWSERQNFVNRIVDSEAMTLADGGEFDTKTETADSTTAVDDEDAAVEPAATETTVDTTAIDAPGARRSQADCRTDESPPDGSEGDVALSDGSDDTTDLSSGNTDDTAADSTVEPSTLEGANCDDEPNANPRSQHPYEQLTEQFADLSAQVERLQRRLATNRSDTVITDPELAHKVVHACFDSEHISDDEELQILKEFIGPSDERSSASSDS